ncbi:MAG: glycosyltransferase [Syntrophales bacterium]
MNKNDKVILFISDLDFAKTGNQILLNTVLFHIRNDFKVILLTSSPTVDDDFDGIEFPENYRDKIVIKRFCPLFRFQRRMSIMLLQHIFKFIRNTFPPADSLKKLSEITKTTPFTFYPTLSFFSFFLGGLFSSINLVRKYRPQIICGYEPRGIVLGWVISRLFSIKLISRFQGTLLFPEMKNKYKAFLKYPFYIISMILPTDLAIMENDGTRGKEVLLELGVPESKIKFRIDGVYRDIFIPNYDKEYILEKYNLEKDTKIILTVSRLVLWKRVDRIIFAMQEVAKKIPNSILIIVGGGDQEESLRVLSKNLGLDKRIIFSGPIKYNEIKYYINSCDIFCSFYEYSNLCNPVLEALVCGRCIISVNDGSTKDILINNCNSILIEKENLENDIPLEIIRILEDDDLRTKIMDNVQAFSRKYLLPWPKRMDLETEEINKLLI